jgi:branched-chain amino acid transport system substrate-binding protein
MQLPTVLMSMGARLGPVLACGGAAVAVAGCTAPAASSVKVTGATLTVYASLPPGPIGPATQDMIDAEQLALRQSGASVDKYTVRLDVVHGNKLSDNARSAIQDTSAIAYIGELAPGASADSIGITNAEDLLQVSPTDTAAALTQVVSAVPNSPKLYYETFGTYGHTFARVTPSTAPEAAAVAAQMRAANVTRLYIAQDTSDYAKAIVAELRSHLPASITVVSSAGAADGAFVAAADPSTGARLVNSTASGAPKAKIFVPSAMASSAFAGAVSAAAQPAITVSSPGFKGNLTASGTSFESSFSSSFGHPPAPQAIFAYEAMDAVLAVLHQAGASANSRTTVVKDFLALRNRSSVLGTYSIDPDGDTNLAPFVFSHIQNGALVPFVAAQG